MATGANTIRIKAVVTGQEQRIFEAAAARLGEALSQAAGKDWTCDCEFLPDLAALQGATDGCVVVTSLLGPLQRLDTPWAELEAELRTAYAALCETGSPIMVCTLLRHVPASEGHEAADRTRLRLRRLDLLVTELSREYGALVIDLDRILADIGARRLETDYRLGGEPVVSFASNAIAISIVSNALDDFVAYEIQNAARTLLERDRPVVGVMAEIKMTNLMTLGSGRRKQFASTVTDSVQENHVGWLVQQVLKGQIGPAEALNRLAQAMRNRGARESAALLIKGVTRLFKHQA